MDDLSYIIHTNESHCNIIQYHVLKGLRTVLEGFVVTMHEGTYETGSQFPRVLAEGFDVLFAQTRVHCDNKPQ